MARESQYYQKSDETQFRRMISSSVDDALLAVMAIHVTYDKIAPGRFNNIRKILKLGVAMYEKGNYMRIRQDPRYYDSATYIDNQATVIGYCRGLMHKMYDRT